MSERPNVSTASPSTTPAAVPAAPPDWIKAEHDDTQIYERRVHRRVAARYEADVERCSGSSTIRQRPSITTAAAKTTAPVGSTVPDHGPYRIPDHFGSVIASSSITTQAATTLKDGGARRVRFSARHPHMPSVDLLEPWRPKDCDLLFDREVDGALQESDMEAKTKTYKTMRREHPQKSVSFKDQGTQAKSGKKDPQGASDMKGKQEEAEEDDWVIVKDPWSCT
ncbi:MAG: hypothetical protein Q9221_004460 [Calogaya cf. arnoldii]